MGYSTRLWKQIYHFIYYRLANVLEHCFAYVTRYIILEYGGKWVESQQLILPCTKSHPNLQIGITCHSGRIGL